MSNPIVLPGQMYLHVELNDYIVITKNSAGYVSYEGKEVRGKCDISTLMDQTVFMPSDPASLTNNEIMRMQSHLRPGTKLSTGVVVIDDDLDD